MNPKAKKYKLDLNRIRKIDFNTPEMEKVFERVKEQNKKMLESTRVSPESLLTRFDI